MELSKKKDDAPNNPKTLNRIPLITLLHHRRLAAHPSLCIRRYVSLPNPKTQSQLGRPNSRANQALARRVALPHREIEFSKNIKWTQLVVVGLEPVNTRRKVDKV
jgi:hypothetical protein